MHQLSVLLLLCSHFLKPTSFALNLFWGLGETLWWLVLSRAIVLVFNITLSYTQLSCVGHTTEGTNNFTSTQPSQHPIFKFCHVTSGNIFVSEKLDHLLHPHGVYL